MRNRPPPDDTPAGGDGYGGEPRPGASASTFDAAQELLQAALEEMRGVDQRNPAPPAAAEGARAVAKTPTPVPRGQDIDQPTPSVLWPASPAPAPAPDIDQPNPSVFWAAAPDPAPATPQSSGQSTSAAPAPTAARSRRRRPHATPPPASASDELEGVTDTLFEAPARGTRRRRRPESTAVAAAAVGGTLAGTGVPTTNVEAPLPAVATSRVAEVPEGSQLWEVSEGWEPSKPTIVPGQSWSASDGVPAATSRRRTQKIVAAIAAALVGVAALALITSGGGSDEPAVQASGRARLTFAPITTPEGATVTRVWELQGPKGSAFEGTLSFENPTAAPVKTTFTEVIPKALAASVGDITFNPQPVVIKADPIVQYQVTVPAGGTFTATYQIEVSPDGVDRRRLDAWARDLPPQTTVSTTTTTKAPTTAPTAPTALTAPPTSASSTPPKTTPATSSPPKTTPPNTNPPEPPPITSPPEPPPTTSPPEPPPNTNPPVEKGTIVIQVVSRGKGGTFGYSTPNGGISLTTPGANSFASWSTSVDPGSYTLTQTSTPAEFYIQAIQCSNGVSSGRNVPSVSIAVKPGETVSCTFENRPT